LLKIFTGFAVWQKTKKSPYLGHIAELERNIFLSCQVKPEERAGGVLRHARHD
jgi:hypothetical protein